MTAELACAALALAVWLHLLFFRGGFWLGRDRDDREAPPMPGDGGSWPSVAAIVPARDEAAMLPESLGSLLAQDYRGALSVVLIDDQSTDGTAGVARRVAADAGREVTVIEGLPLAPGWTGKSGRSIKGSPAPQLSKTRPSTFS